MMASTMTAESKRSSRTCHAGTPPRFHEHAATIGGNPGEVSISIFIYADDMMRYVA